MGRLGLSVIAAAIMLSAAARGAIFIEGDLARQADLQFATTQQAGKLRVTEVEKDSPAFAAGLETDDEIVAVNGERFVKSYHGAARLERLKGGRKVSIVVRRAGGETELSFVPVAKPWEEIAGLDSYFGVLDMPDGSRLRTILTRPQGTRGPLPAVFVVQWVGCDSVEFTREGAWIDVYKGIAQRSGYAMIRIERSANGDSSGPACHELDFETELAHYRFAFERLTRGPHVDPSRVVVMGNSLGSLMAPFVAEGRKVAGVTVASGGALTYFERMIYFDRLALERGGGRPEDIQRKLLEQARFHVEYLLNGKTPEQIARENPRLGAVWTQIPHTGDGVHYGRPYAYHHQAARRNAIAAWAAIQAPILVLFNEFDQYESRHGAEVIVEVVNRLRPGSAKFVELPMLEHSFYRYPSADLAFVRDRRYRVAEPEPAIAAILEWLADDVGRR